MQFLSSTNGGSWDIASDVLISAMKSSQWYHIAVTRSGTSFKAFVNGIQQSFSITSSGTLYNSAGQKLYIGGRVLNDDSLNGYMSDVRLTKGTALYTSSFVPPTQALTSPATTPASLLLNFNNGGIIDQHGTNVLETVGNAQLSTAVKKYNVASMYFDGTGDCLLFQAGDRFAFGTGDYTVEAWVYFTSINSSSLQIIFTSGSTGGNNFYCHVDVDQISVGTTAAFVSNQTSSFSINTWYHIAFCRSSGTLRLFKDGVQQGSNVTDSTNWISSGTGRIGANEIGTQTVFGYIDDLRITKGVARYTTTFTPPTSALITK